MAASLDFSKQGALFDLERLQKKADRLNAKRDVESKLKTEVVGLHKKVQELKKRKAELLMRLKESPTQVLQQHLEDTNTPKSEGSTTKFTADADLEVIGESLQVLRKRQLSELCDAYRLTGISLVSQEARKVCFRCETFFNGEYFEPYYIEILKGDKLTLGKHTVPYFVPLQHLIDKHLNSDLKQFFILLGQYLSAFVSRRQQVCILSDRYEAMMEMQPHSSPAYDFVQFTVKASKGADTEVKLSYNDLRSSLPSDGVAAIKSTGKASSGSKRRSTLRRYRELFKRLPLHDAFSQAFT